MKMWDYRYGGTGFEFIRTISRTSDGGFILGGYSESGIGGDKSQNTWGSYDYWIVKTDSLGIKQWDKNFGGSDVDYLFCIQQTYDGGYILGGFSYSGISGDKTQNTWGFADYWIVKIDSLGNKQWDKNFGGTDYDFFSYLSQTSDSGYIFGGYSVSGIGGDKTQGNLGGYDYWIVKTDSLGNKLWDKNFGGTSLDALRSLTQTSDRGYILGGNSDSNIGGDKSQTTQGNYDYWIIKIDSLGNKLWDKDFGGGNSDEFISIIETNDNGFILGGQSNSFVSGDKTQNTWGLVDFWIVKTDSLGNKQWDKDFGGTTDEELNSISKTSDGGYLLAGDSYSGISGNKSESNLGTEQTWVVKTDSLGNFIWDKTIFTFGHDENGLALQTVDGCYLMANSTQASGGYKTQVSQGGYDYWMVKFCDALQAGFTAPAFICPGTCIDFTNLSVSASSYQWYFPGASPDTSTATNPTNICYANPGSYDVSLIAGNANSIDTLTIVNYLTVYPQPPPQGIMQSGDTLFANPGSPSYQWFFNGNIIAGATNYFYVATQSGDYNVVATDTNGCEVEAVINDVIASIQYTVDSKQISIYPNPVLDKFTIQNSQVIRETASEISISNIMGKKVMTVSPLSLGEGPGGEAVDCSLLSKGIYWLEIISGDKFFRSKFVKQ